MLVEVTVHTRCRTNTMRLVEAPPKQISQIWKDEAYILMVPDYPERCMDTHCTFSEMYRGTTFRSYLYSSKDVQARLDRSGVHNAV